MNEQLIWILNKQTNQDFLSSERIIYSILSLYFEFDKIDYVMVLESATCLCSINLSSFLPATL